MRKLEELIQQVSSLAFYFIQITSSIHTKEYICIDIALVYSLIYQLTEENTELKIVALEKENFEQTVDLLLEKNRILTEEKNEMHLLLETTRVCNSYVVYNSDQKAIYMIS